MCNSKIDITLKLRTADICTPCIDLFLTGGLTNATLFQSMKFLEELRSNFLLQDSYNKNLKPLTLRVKNTNNNLEIWIEETFIKFTKTELFLYYILCVAKEKGNDFSKNIAEKKKNKRDKVIYVDNFINESRQTFLNLRSVNIENYFEDNLTNVAKNVTIINDKLNETLGFNLAKFYTIKKRQPDLEGIKEKLTRVLEELNKQMDQLHLDKLLDKKDKANKKKEINTSIKSNTKLINLQRGENLPYTIELFTRKDYKEYYELAIN
jgi:response regulator of citrate/malate metabolism